MTPPDQPESGPRDLLPVTYTLTLGTSEFKTVVELSDFEEMRDHFHRKCRQTNDLLREKFKAEARIAELKRDIEGADGWRDSCAHFEKRAKAAERERDENERLLVLALKCDRSTIALLEDANAENARLRPVVEKLAGEDGFPFGYLELLAREALK